MRETAIPERKNRKKMKTNYNLEPSKLEGLADFPTSIISLVMTRGNISNGLGFFGEM